MLHPALLAASLLAADAEDVDKKYPLDAQLRVLAEDVKNADYRKLVTEKMLVTDLAAEWQRVATADNPDSFLKRHGGKDKVDADPDLKRAYERRVRIRDDFLDLMRDGYRRYKTAPPFDKGAKAEEAGTLVRKPAAGRVALAVVPPATDAQGHWPRYRGPGGQGETGLSSLPVTWDKSGTNLAWRVKVPGEGNSSPVVWGDRIFLTSAKDKGKERLLHCLDRRDGRLLWSRTAPARPPEPGVRPKNGFASATPATDGERVVVFLGSCGLLCYDFDGKLLWSYDEFKLRTTHGTGSSPLLYKDLAIFIHDQNQSESVCLALDKRTGKVVWRQKRPRAMTWSTPTVVRVGDRDELLFAGAETVKGYDPATGQELWTLKGPTHEVVPALVVGPDLVYSASGRNGPVIAFRPGGSGDVTETHLVWRAVRGGPHVPSPILVGGRLFTVNDTGIAQCLDAATGKLLWHRRLNDQFSASPVEAGGLLYFPAESGVTYVLRAADAFELVAKNDLGAGILASPAIADGRLILRTQDELVCVGPALSAAR
jgi:outer membrane protein assembly factor BamB